MRRAIAKILIQQEQQQKAYFYVERMVKSVQASLSFHYRRHRKVVKQGERLLKQLAPYA